MYVHAWMVHIINGSQFVTFSGDQNDVFEYLVLQSLLLTANFRKSNRQKIFFLFQHLTFTIWLLCILNLFLFGECRNITREGLNARLPKVFFFFFFFFFLILIFFFFFFFFFITCLPKRVGGYQLLHRFFAMTPPILTIFVLKDRYGRPHSVDTKRYQKPFFWRHDDVLMTSESQKTGFYWFSSK